MSRADDPYTIPESLVEAARWDSALPAIGAALASYPDDPRLLGLLVRTLRALQRHQEAIDASQRLLSVAPNEPYSYRLVTLVMLDAGWVDEAVGLAARAVQLDPGNAANHLALSRAWASSRRPGAVRAQLASAQQAVMLSPSSPDAHVQIGAALAADNDLDAARAAYLEALRLDPQNSAALNNLAVLDLRAGLTSSASRYIAAALAVAPQGTIARRNLDVICRRVLNRVAWWMLLSPLPALALALAGWSTAARATCLIVLLGPVTTTWRWYSGLTLGQRIHVRGYPRRARRRVFLWPGSAAVLGITGLIQAWTGADWAYFGGRWDYLFLVAAIVAMKLLAVLAEFGPRALVANQRLRLRALRRRES